MFFYVLKLLIFWYQPLDTLDKFGLGYMIFKERKIIIKVFLKRKEVFVLILANLNTLVPSVNIV